MRASQPPRNPVDLHGLPSRGAPVPGWSQGCSLESRSLPWSSRQLWAPARGGRPGGKFVEGCSPHARQPPLNSSGMPRGSVQKKKPQSRRHGQYPVLKNGPLDRRADRIRIIQHCLEIILGLAPQLTAPCVTQTVEVNNLVSITCPGIRKVTIGAPTDFLLLLFCIGPKLAPIH